MAGALLQADIDILMASIIRRTLYHRRIYRCGDNAFILHDDVFFNYFRLTKELVYRICEELRVDLEPKTTNNTALTVEKKVLCALRFYAVGSYQQAVANDFNLQVSQASISNSVRQVSAAIKTHLFKKWVTFPTSASDLQRNKVGFMVKSGFPGVIGAIDCKHIEIIAPPVNDPICPEHIYVNRHHTHSVYAQMVCDSNLVILSCNVRYPGSTHDAFIWRNSGLKRKVAEISASNQHTWLIGDSGYPLEPWLMVPFPSISSPAEQRFNNALCKARNPVERCFGVLKSRFRCLHGERKLHHYPTAAAYITIACVTLHNICKLNGVPDVDVVPDPYDNDSDDEETQVHQAAVTVRNQLVQNYFSN